MRSPHLSIFRSVVAILFVYIAVIARIPTKKCTCNEKKQSTTQSTECPFGEARLLTQVALLSSAIEVPAPPRLHPEFQPRPPTPITVESRLVRAARAPPTSTSAMNILCFCGAPALCSAA